MKSFESLEAMIKATMPKNLNSKEELFFRRWFGKYGLNNDANTNAFCDLIKKRGIDKKSFRDLLFAIGVKCQNDNDISILKYSGKAGKDLDDYVILINQKSLLNNINYILEEAELIDSVDGKKSKIYIAIGYLNKLFSQMNYREFPVIKKIMKKIMEFDHIEREKLIQLFKLSDMLTLNEKDKSLIFKVKKKFNVE